MKQLWILALLFCTFACKQNQELIIIHTNDTHAHYEPLHSGNELGRGGLIERAAFIDSVRAAVGENNVLLLHAGDFSQGTTYFSELKGQFEACAINALRYDCVVLGNHEFDNGIDDLASRLASFESTKVVSSNIEVSGLSIEPYVKPYAVFERAGKKIGVIGIEPNLAAAVSAAVSSQIKQLDNVEVVNKWAAYLRNDLHCNLVILLSHAGFEDDMQLVPNICGVDVIIGGHSHTDFTEPFIGIDAEAKRVPIVSDGRWGTKMGLLKIR